LPLSSERAYDGDGDHVTFMEEFPWLPRLPSNIISAS
jgi:hypothetical protein